MSKSHVFISLCEKLYLLGQIFKSLENLDWDIDVITEYSDDVLKDKMEEVKAELLQSKEYKEYKRVWAKLCKKTNGR
jgi:hypothetical protein